MRQITNDLKTATAACAEYAAERTRLLDRGKALEKGITDAAIEREQKLIELGAAEAVGEQKYIDKARAAYSAAGLAYDGKVEARRFITARLGELSTQAKGPLAKLKEAFDIHRGAMSADMQADLSRAAETFAATARPILAHAAAINLPDVSLAKLNTLPGITGPIPIEVDWREDQAAVRLHEQSAVPQRIIGELEVLDYEVENRRQLEEGRLNARATFEEAGGDPFFTALREIKMDDRTYQAGDLFPATACNRALLGSLYRSGRIAQRRRAAA